MNSSISRGRSSPWTKLLLTIPIGLVVFEVVGRLSARVRGRAHQPTIVLNQLQAALDSMRGAADAPLPRRQRGSEGAPRNASVMTNVPHPYVGWDAGYGLQRLEEDLAYFQGGGGADTYDILLLGSSVAAGFGERGGLAMAKQLEQSGWLTEKPVRLLRYGRGAFKQPQSLLQLTYLLSLGIEPDMVLCIDGFNELTAAKTNVERGVHPAYPNCQQWIVLLEADLGDAHVRDLLWEVRLQVERMQALLFKARRWRLAHSFLASLEVTRRAREIHDDWIAAQEALRAHAERGGPPDWQRGPTFDGDVCEGMEASLDVWERASLSLHQLCHAKGIASAQVVQPNAGVPEARVLTEEEQGFLRAAPAWHDIAKEGYPKVLGRARRLRGEGWPIIDATTAFAAVPETVFRDAGHLNRRGSNLLGLFLAAELQSLGLAALTGQETQPPGSFRRNTPGPAIHRD